MVGDLQQKIFYQVKVNLELIIMVGVEEHHI